MSDTIATSIMIAGMAALSVFLLCLANAVKENAKKTYDEVIDKISEPPNVGSGVRTPDQVAARDSVYHCKYCESRMDSHLSRCPNCGAPNKD